MKKNNISKNEIKLTLYISLFIASFLLIIKSTPLNWYTKWFTFPFSCLLIGFFFLLYILKIETENKNYFLLLPILLILLSSLLINIDWTNKILNFFVLPILISIFFIKIINPKWEITKKVIYLPFTLFPKNIGKNLQELNMLKTKKEINISNVSNIAIGCVIGIPLALILLSLLCSADEYFASLLQKCKFLLNHTEKWDYFLSQSLNFLFLFIFFYVIYCNVLKHKELQKKETKMPKNISPICIKTILMIINTVFLLFLISEISKLTCNFLQLPTEYTYATYAREGFFELLFITLINFSILLFIINHTSGKEEKGIKKLLLTLILFSLFLIANSYYRMFLYIKEYQLTILRLQVILFLLMECLLFIGLIKKIYFNFRKKESFYYFLVIICTYIANLYLCNSYLIEKINSILF